MHRPDGEVVYIKLDQVVFVMTAKDTGAAERAHSMVQLLSGHSDVRESVEEVMQIIENDGLLAKDDTRYEFGQRRSDVETRRGLASRLSCAPPVP